jgi:hypothetical protein
MFESSKPIESDFDLYYVEMRLLQIECNQKSMDLESKFLSKLRSDYITSNLLETFNNGKGGAVKCTME